MMIITGARSAQRTFCFCLQQQTVCVLNDHCSANGHVPLINLNSSFIAHSLGDIEYFCVMKKTLWVPPSLFAKELQFVVCFRLANVRCQQSFSRANGANVQQNVRCVRCAERTPDLCSKKWCETLRVKHMTQAFTQNRPGGDLPWGRLRTFSDVTIMCFLVRAFPMLARGYVYNKLNTLYRPRVPD